MEGLAVGTSRIRLELDGEAVEAETSRLLSADVLLARRCVGAFSLVFADSPLSSRLDRTRRVVISVPDPTPGIERARALIAGDVTATRHERDTTGGSAVVLRGFDGGGRLAGMKRTRSWRDVDAFDVAEALAREHGLEFERTGSDEASEEFVAIDAVDAVDAVDASLPPVPSLQTNESDWAFLRALAEREGGELQVDRRRLLFGSSPIDARDAVEITPGQEPSLQGVESDGRRAELVLRGAWDRRPAELVRMNGCGPRVDGLHRVEEIRFLLDGAGWTTLAVVERVG